MARHSTCIGAAYICILSSSPTKYSGDLQTVHRKSEGVTSRVRRIHHMHIPGTYTYHVLDERLILATCYDTILLLIAYNKGRNSYNIPIVIERRKNTAYTATYKPRHDIRTVVARLCRICSLSGKRPTREVYLTGLGCFVTAALLNTSSGYRFLQGNTTIRKCKRKFSSTRETNKNSMTLWYM